MGYFRDNVEKTAGYVPGFQPNQTDVVKLNTNENPYPPSPAAIKAVSNLTTERLRKYPDPRADIFRKATGQLHGVEPENIICCNGGDDLLSISIRAFCDSQRSVAYPVPTYSLYSVLAQMHNCPTVELPFVNDFGLPDELASTGAALTIICNPNAPSGTFVSAEKIARLVEKLSGVLLVDEAYVDFAEQTCIELVKSFDNVLILRSMSKGYSLAGIRFGYGIAQKNLIEGLEKVRDSYAVDAIAIAAATAAIKDQKYFRKNIEKIKQQRTRLTKELCDLGFEVSDSLANFVLAQSKNHRASEIYEKLTQRKIFVRYFDTPDLADKLRITIGTKEQNNILINELKKILSE